MRLLILVIILGATAILILQNLTPLSLIFFNTTIPLKLPLGLWVVLFTLAGIVTSITWQLLREVSQVQTSNRYTDEPRRTQNRSSVIPEAPRDRPSAYRRSSNSSQNSISESDWEIGKNENWEQNMPSDTNTKPENLGNREQAQEKFTDEVRSEPKTTSRSDSVYSYGYRESKDPALNKIDQVYDANYRVIRPPYQEPSSQTNGEEDEEWV